MVGDVRVVEGVAVICDAWPGRDVRVRRARLGAGGCPRARVVAAAIGAVASAVLSRGGGAGGQAGSVASRLNAWAIAPLQGQSAGRCSVSRRAWRVRRPATCSSR